MVVAERDVGPSLGAQLLARDLQGRPIAHDRPRQHPFDFTVQQQHVVASRRVRGQRRSQAHHVGHGQDREVALREREALGCGVHDVEPEGREQAQNAPGFGGARRVMVARDHDDDGVGKPAAEPRELIERVQNGRIRRPHVVKDVAGHDDHIWARAR